MLSPKQVPFFTNWPTLLASVVLSEALGRGSTMRGGGRIRFVQILYEHPLPCNHHKGLRNGHCIYSKVSIQVEANGNVVENNANCRVKRNQYRTEKWQRKQCHLLG